MHFAEHKRSPFKLCGKPFVLNSDQKGLKLITSWLFYAKLLVVVMYTQPPPPSTILNQKKRALLWKGRKVAFQGALVFERSESANHPTTSTEVWTHLILRKIELLLIFFHLIG